MWPRSFRSASQHTHRAARSPLTIPTNRALPATSLILLRPKRLSNRSVSRRGPSLFRALRMRPTIGRTPGSLLSAVNSLAGSITSPRSLISKTISAFRSSPYPRSPGVRRNVIARMCVSRCISKELIFMKAKAFVFAFAAILFVSLAAQAATVVACCGNPACCDSGGCCK
jgi:hypothetical protein